MTRSSNTEETTQALEDNLIWHKDAEMASWMMRNYSRLSTTNNGIFFMMHMLKNYFCGILELSNTSSSDQIEIKHLNNIVELVDEFVFEKIFTNDDENTEDLKYLSTVETEIYLSMCRYFEEHIEVGKVGCMMIDFFFRDAKFFRKNSEFLANRELKLFFMQNLISAALSFYSPTLLECLACILLDESWYDRNERCGGRLGDNSPLYLIKQLFYETCATVPIGEEIYRDLFESSPKFAFLTLYTVLHSFTLKITREKIQDNVFERASNYCNSQPNHITKSLKEADCSRQNNLWSLKSLPAYFFRVLSYWLKHYFSKLAELKISPTVCLPLLENNCMTPNNAHNCIVFDSVLSSLMVVSMVCPLFTSYPTIHEYSCSIHYELIDYLQNMSLHFSLIRDTSNSTDIDFWGVTSILDPPNTMNIPKNNREIIEDKSKISQLIATETKYTKPREIICIAQSDSRASSASSNLAIELEEGEVSSEATSPTNHHGNNSSVENSLSTAQDINFVEMNDDGDIDDDASYGSVMITAVSNSLMQSVVDNPSTVNTLTNLCDADTILVFHGTSICSDTYCSNELLGNDQQWIDYLDMLVRIGSKIGKHSNLSICIERFCQFFNGYTFAKRCFTLKGPFIEKATILRNLVRDFDPVGCLDQIISLVMKRY